ncbi:MAG: radical SAM protein, partial [Clostridia bacterium]|nr:radical SAM protein [Clostridia bacterium]
MTASAESISEQYADGVAALSRKWSDFGVIPYLQSNTCTYDEPENLRRLYRECAALPGAVMLAVGTRADCLQPEVIEVLRRVSEEIPLIVELGLQTSDDETAKRINRCHTRDEFEDGYRRLRDAGGDIAVCVHIINGLPGESAA